MTHAMLTGINHQRFNDATGSVRVWSLQSTAVVVPERMVRLDVAARAVCYSPDGTSIAVGCGGGGGR
jgi:hypothetical protein